MARSRRGELAAGVLWRQPHFFYDTESNADPNLDTFGITIVNSNFDPNPIAVY